MRDALIVFVSCAVAAALLLAVLRELGKLINEASDEMIRRTNEEYRHEDL